MILTEMANDKLINILFWIDVCYWHKNIQNVFEDEIKVSTATYLNNHILNIIYFIIASWLNHVKALIHFRILCIATQMIFCWLLAMKRRP